MQKLSTMDWVALILVIVGGLNWLLVGLFGLDIVSTIFGSMSAISKVVYVLVGLSAIYLLIMSGKLMKK